MASLIDPRCGAQPYSLSEDVAARCGSYGGALGGLVVGIVVAVFVLTWLPSGPSHGLPLWAKITIAVAALVCAPALLWLLGGFVGRREQQTAQVELTARRASGMTTAEALKSVQDLQNSQRGANAMLGAGAMVASSIASRA